MSAGGTIRTYAAAPGAPWLLLAHGAGAGHDHPWMRRVAAGLAARGVSVATFDFPHKAARRSMPDKPAVLEAAFAAGWTDMAAQADGAAMFAGGKSMGGRIASQVAAAQVTASQESASQDTASQGTLVPPARGLVFFGYPLHPPAKPDQRRDRHLPAIAAPMLFLHGTRDPFGSPDEMRALAAGLTGATLELMDGGDHSLAGPKKHDPAGTMLERAMDVAAAWISARAADPSAA